MEYKTEQEQFWAGKFGVNYVDRNNDPTLLASNINLFSKVMSKTSEVNSVIEFGSNIGLNLRAIKSILPNVECGAVEINKVVADILKTSLPDTRVWNESILDCKIEQQFDFVLIKGVLIHINPNELDKVYELLYHTSKRYICIAEYYNPTPVELTYRGNEGKLFKRDFAGELMDKYKNLELIDYGFSYHRDNNFPQDDLTWFLLKK